MILEPFAFENSIIHRLDPRLRLVFAVVFSIATALTQSFAPLYPALGISIILVAMARLDSLALIKRIAVVNVFVLFLWVVLPFTYEGDAVFIIGPLAATEQGLMLCGLITLKSNAILLVFISMVATMPVAVMGHAMGRLKVPPKIILLLLLTYRYIFVIEQEYQRLLRAARVRGFAPKTSMHTYRTYAYLVGMLFVRASERAKNVDNAMVCRGFSGEFHSLTEFAFKPVDSVAAVLMVLALVIIEGARWASILI